MQLCCVRNEARKPHPHTFGCVDNFLMLLNAVYVGLFGLVHRFPHLDNKGGDSYMVPRKDLIRLCSVVYCRYFPLPPGVAVKDPHKAETGSCNW